MWQNTKLLSIASILIVILGLGFLWFGLNIPAPQKDNLPTNSVQENLIVIEGQKAFVEKVVDGDTIEVLIEGEKKTVRLLGVDTPETKDPRKSVQCFGKEASNKTKNLPTGKEVVLQKDVSEVDKYGRLLRFVYLPLPGGQTLFVDDYLIREGFARVLTIPPDVKYATQFLEAQRRAREANKGLWGRC